MSKILIIDDETDILNTLQFTLQLEGYEVVAAGSGQEGIDRFLECPDVDVVVSDMKMPGLSGLDVIRTIRGHSPEIAIIILTGDEDLDHAVSAMKEGAYDYLAKPVHHDRLVLSVENAISQYNLVKENRKLNEEIVRKNLYFQAINESASQILYNMAPKNMPTFDALGVSAIYQCCEHVGGDMYDVFALGDKILFYLFDVCGHGILSAVMTMILKSSFNNLKVLYGQAGIVPDIEYIVRTINDEMYANTSPNLYATLFAGLYDQNTHEISYISAGHVDQYLISDAEVRTLCSTGTVIGIFNDTVFTSEKIRVHPSERLYLFTDGITEIWQDNTYISNEAIVKIIADNHRNTLEESVSRIYDHIIELYRNEKPDDDITILGLEFKQT